MEAVAPIRSEVIIRWGWDNWARLGASAMHKSGLNQCRKLPQVLAWILPRVWGGAWCQRTMPLLREVYSPAHAQHILYPERHRVKRALGGQWGALSPSIVITRVTCKVQVKVIINARHSFWCPATPFLFLGASTTPWFA